MTTQKWIEIKMVISLFITMSVFIMTFSSCDWAKDKTKKAVNKTSEIVVKTSSEFGDGIYKGVKKTFDNDVKISDQLKTKGLELGEVLINSSDTARQCPSPHDNSDQFESSEI
jgi:hypothetical protein